MWTKIENKRVGVSADHARVQKYNSGQPMLHMPAEWGWFSKGDSVNIYTDGSGRLGFRAESSGIFKVSGNGRTTSVSIPAKFAESIPSGTTKVAPIRDETGLVVLDLAKIHRLNDAA